MSVKYYKEDVDEKIIKQDITATTLPDFIQRIAVAICSEHQSIAEYDTILSDPGICDETRAIIEEIRKDEMDHACKLSCLVAKLTNYALGCECSESEDIADEPIEDVPSEDEIIDDTDIADMSDDEDLSDIIDIPDEEE